MKKYNLKEFQLSQAYLFYWDKLEKANYFLENILDTLDEPLDGRWMQALLASPVGDGGQWDMLANLVEKYGLVSIFDEVLCRLFKTYQLPLRFHTNCIQTRKTQ